MLLGQPDFYKAFQFFFWGCENRQPIKCHPIQWKNQWL